MEIKSRLFVCKKSHRKKKHKKIHFFHFDETPKTKLLKKIELWDSVLK
jgi:hypothetical protein